VSGLHRIFGQPYINGDGKIEMQLDDTFFGTFTFSLYGCTDDPLKDYNEQYAHRTPLISVNFICGHESFSLNPGAAMTSVFTTREDEIEEFKI
jgi:hypothetical protein